MNSKKEFLYNLVFESLIYILGNENGKRLNIETIVTDHVVDLIKVVTKIFPTVNV